MTLTNHCLFLYVYLQDPEPVDSFGDIYQDEGNMAAVLMRKHLESGDLMMVSITFRLGSSFCNEKR